MPDLNYNQANPDSAHCPETASGYGPKTAGFNGPNRPETGRSPGATCQKIADMIQYAGPIVERWPRFYRQSLGIRVMDKMYQMLDLATKAAKKYMNQSTLKDLDVCNTVLNALILQANNTFYRDKGGNQRRLLTDQSYGVWLQKVAEIGRLIGGWLNATAGRTSK